jgi:hypothetical protein
MCVELRAKRFDFSFMFLLCIAIFFRGKPGRQGSNFFRGMGCVKSGTVSRLLC